MKNLMVKTVAAVFAVCLVLGVSDLYARGGDRDGQGRGGKTEKARYHKGEPFDIGRMCEDLKIEGEQKEKLIKERKQHRERIRELRGDLRDQRKALSEEIDKEKSDRKKLNSISSKLKKTMSKMVDERLESALKVKETLTTEQYKEFQGKRERNRNKDGKKNKKKMKKRNR